MANAWVGVKEKPLSLLLLHQANDHQPEAHQLHCKLCVDNILRVYKYSRSVEVATLIRTYTHARAYAHAHVVAYNDVDESPIERMIYISSLFYRMRYKNTYILIPIPRHGIRETYFASDFGVFFLIFFGSCFCCAHSVYVWYLSLQHFFLRRCHLFFRCNLHTKPRR